MKRVYFLDTVHPVLEERLSKAGFLCLDLTKNSKEEVKNKIVDAYGLVLRSKFTMDRAFLTVCKKLNFIARSGSGLENIDLEYCSKHTINVYNSPEGNRDAVAEHTLGFLLGLLNNFKQSNNDLANGNWFREKNRGAELENQRIGIVGYGNNGKAFAQRLEGLGVEVFAYDKYKTGFSKGRIRESSLEEIHKHATGVSFHVPLTADTLYMADYQFFKRFSSSVFVLNISRGKVLKTKDLLRALDEGLVSGAGLDVLEEESNSFDLQVKNESILKLNGHPNVILTPHVAGWTKESYFKLSNILAEKILNRKSPL